MKVVYHSQGITSIIEEVKYPMNIYNMSPTNKTPGELLVFDARGGMWLRKYHTDTLALQETVNQELLFKL